MVFDPVLVDPVTPALDGTAIRVVHRLQSITFVLYTTKVISFGDYDIIFQIFSLK